MNMLSKIFNNFSDEWAFERTMHDLVKDETLGSAIGEAKFDIVLPQRQLHYRETSLEEFTGLPSIENEFHLDFIYTLQSEDHLIYVDFGNGPSTGRLYQRYYFDRNKSQLIAQKDRAKYRYNSIYTLQGENHFTVTTTKKEQGQKFQLKTLYSRIS